MTKLIKLLCLISFLWSSKYNNTLLARFLLWVLAWLMFELIAAADIQVVDLFFLLSGA